jgi:hemerythrin-like metal-binding protein
MDASHLEWSLDLAVGITDLDDAHRELVDLYNRIAWACENDRRVENVRERIRTFLTYARWHFDQEEAFMHRLRYPGYVDHKADHQRLLQDAGDFVESFGGALGSDDSAAIASYFKYWLTRHMAGQDGHLKTYLKSAERASPE